MLDTTTFYLILSGLLFSLGTLGVLMRRNAIIVFMCIELMLNAANIAIVALSNRIGVLDGQIYVIFVMAIAAAEAAVGLAIILAVFRNYRTTDLSKADILHG